MKKCIKCLKEKKLEEFPKTGKWYRSKCKFCHRIPQECKKENSGRFKKGNISKVPFKKGISSWNKGIISDKGTGRKCGKYKIWKHLVRERDQNKCIKCDATEKLHTHHIISWKSDENKRFDVENGLTLCSKCHYLEENVLVKLGVRGHFKPHTEESRKKISESKKGKKLKKREYKNEYIPWNKGKKLSEEHRKKLSEAKIGHIPWNKGMTQK